MCRVLILDDEPDFGHIIKQIIEVAEEGRPDVVATEAEALSAAARALRRGKPYEVFLIDQRLGPGKDGIEVLKDLRRLSPESDAIIFTGYEDMENGLRAYQAGAFRYISKPFRNEELLFLLKQIKEFRKEMREHFWQKIFSQMIEETLHKVSFLDTAKTVVEYARKLGFVRAHLFWVPRYEQANLDNEMIGITCVGTGRIKHFSQVNGRYVMYPLARWFDLAKMNDVICVRPDENTEAQMQLAGNGYKWPAGECAILPLRSSTRLLGALLLDHGAQARSLSEHERTMLNFFARQVSLALENASLYIQERRSREEADVISTVGKEVSARAATNNMEALLSEVHLHMSKLMIVSHLTLALRSPETGDLEIHRQHEHARRYELIHHPSSSGLEGYIIDHQAGVPPVSDVPAFVQQRHISMYDPLPVEWMGVPLMVGDNVIGALILQQFEVRRAYTQRDWQILVAVANQIAGAIQLNRLHQNEKRESERLNLLKRATTEMLRVAQRNEIDLWLTAITIATANYGTAFNRALLFLENTDHTALGLITAVGTEDAVKAHRDWERDERHDHQFDDFLADLEHARVPATDFASLAGEIVVPLDEHARDAFNAVMRTGILEVVKEHELTSRLPQQLTGRVSLAECAIVPLRTGVRTIGLMVVDNKHNKTKLKQSSLYRLQTILGYAGLVKETLRQQEKSESLLDANYQIMGGASRETLRDTLKRICQTARTITEADWVIIYPYQEGQEVFDSANVAFDGEIKTPLKEVIVKKPGKTGVSHYVLTHRQLVVDNIAESRSSIVKRLKETHFIKKEGVKALIGVPIQDPLTNQTLGLFYLDYRKIHPFSDQEIHHAHSFASLAAVAINNARRFDQEKQHKRLLAAQDVAEIIGTELNLDQMLIKALDKLQQLFQDTSMGVLMYEERDQGLWFVPATLAYYHMPKASLSEHRLFPINGPSLVCKAAREALRTGLSEPIYEPDVSHNPDYLRLIPNVMSELCISLLGSDKKLLGVLALERAATHGFRDEDIALIETVGRQISMGIERARQSEQLTFKETIAARTAWAADIAHEIKNEIGIIKTATYLIREYAHADPVIMDNVKDIEKSVETLAQADPQKSKNKQPHPVDALLRKFGTELAQSTSVDMALQLNSDGCYVNVSAIEFKRMLRHLTRNAIKAMEGRPEKRIIIRSARLDKKNIEIQFEDFGPGVKDEVRAALFQKRTTTKKSEESGGHGLLFTRQAVEEMGGTIRLLDLEPGRGAVFSIVLPVHDFPESLPE